MRITSTLSGLIMVAVPLMLPVSGKAQSSGTLTPSLSSSPPYSDWGPLHSTSDAQPITFSVQNTGGADANISAVQLGTGTNFSITANNCNVTLAPDDTCDITVLPSTSQQGVNEDGVFLSYNNNSLRIGLRADIEFPNTYAWNYSVQQVPGNIRFLQVSSGGDADCGLDENGVAYCWGVNSRGALGNNSNVGSTTPVPVSGNLSFAQISAGDEQGCGVTASGTAYCWGNNASGQLGNVTSQSISEVPIIVHGSITFKSVSAGTNGTCGVDTQGNGWCWGTGAYGSLGSGNGTQGQIYPVAVAGNHKFTSISTSLEASCGITTSGAAYCWGIETQGMLGNGVSTTSGQYSSVPVAVIGGLSFSQISAGSNHVCALTPSGQAYCWGSNGYGQVGNMTGNNTFYTSPQPVAGNHVFTTVMSGRYFTCGLDGSGQVYCWGVYSSLGNGTNATSSNYPIPILGNYVFSQIAQKSELRGLALTN